MNRSALSRGSIAALALALALACSEEAEQGAGETAESVGVVEIDEFLTNINDASGERYAKLRLKLAVAPEESASAIQDDPLIMARLRDQILTLLTAKTYADLTGPEAKENFRSEVHEKLEPLLEDSELKEVLFAEFVVQ